MSYAAGGSNKPKNRPGSYTKIVQNDEENMANPLLGTNVA